MANIGFLGLGAMGSRMVLRLVNAGHKVTVWNRSKEVMDSFKDVAITAAQTPAQAALGADYVFSMVRDNEASQYVWLDGTLGAINGLSESAIAVECSTLTPHYIANLREKLTAKNVKIVDAPVVGSRPQAEAGKLVFLVGAEKEQFRALENVLSPMAGAVHHLGESGCGSKVKLAVNALFAMQLAGMAELMGYLGDSGVSLESALTAITSLPVASTALKISTEAMLAGQFAPAFPIELVAKDLSYLAESTALVKSETPTSITVGRLFLEAQNQGLGGENITAIAKLFLSNL